MKVIKFGGSSLENADCFKRVAAIINSYVVESAVGVVVSAPKGITNQLISLTSNIEHLSVEAIYNVQKDIRQHLSKIVDETVQHYPQIDQSIISSDFKQLISRMSQLCQGAKLLDHCPETTVAEIITTGEKFSVLLLAGIMKSLNNDVTKLDPKKFLTIDENSVEPIADLALSKSRFKQHYSDIKSVSLMPGFYGVKSNGDLTTLGRNGSDYSAAILAVCAEAEICDVWTDVDGVYNSDPNLVDNAKLLKKMSYNEAMELSYFGAKILHPKTILPLLQFQIPCRIKNTQAPEAVGTLISTETSSDLIKAVTNLPNVTMITVSGPEMRGMVGMASRVFSAISQAEISVIMISQSSAEYSISFCVPGEEAKAAEKCLNKVFELELKSNLLEPINIRENLAIISLVGDRMQHQRGVAAKFFDALSQARVNILAIAQDSSERSISAVVRSKRINDAVKICHNKLFTNKPTIDAILIGCGNVGKELLSQIKRQQKWLNSKNIALNVVAIANSKQLLKNSKDIDLDNWQQLMESASDSLSLETLKAFVEEAQLNNPVIIDCTSSEFISRQYVDYLASGFNVVTANKKANTLDIDYYNQLRLTAQTKQKRFLYETNVAAGLPVIDNLKGLLNAGDSLQKFEGILSGSLSYILGEIHNGLTLSEATLKARDLGYTEPNPAEDLSGLDVARKALVIAREVGMKAELVDINVEPLVPEELANITDADEFLSKLPSFDQLFAEKVKKAEQQSKVLRYIARIEGNKIDVSIKAVDAEHPLFAVSKGENALALHTRYYQPIPFVIRGYGAGAEVTAAGLFGDLLKTISLDNQL